MSNIMIPTVHMNGTCRADLVAENMRAREALDKAIEALAQASPHGRNFYPQGDDAIVRAAKEHRDRLARLNSVLGEIDDIILGIA
jgi:hypothetical protein